MNQRIDEITALLRKGPQTMWVKHRCNHSLTKMTVSMVNDYPAFRCTCGDTVFVSEGQLADWEVESQS